jgi:dipeptidyl aminopeptidase/acylaminoacyl peptidase
MNRRQFITMVAGATGVGLAGLVPSFSESARAQESAAFPDLSEPISSFTFRFLTNNQEFIDARPVFSPDGRSVLFMRSPISNPEGNQATLWIVPAAGGDATLFFGDPNLQTTRPDWSHTRSAFQIAFTGLKKGVDKPGTYLLDVSTKRVKNVLKPGKHIWSYPSWYPDGKHLAVTNYDPFVHQVVKSDLKGLYEPLTDPKVVWAGMSSVSPNSSLGNPIVFAGQIPATKPIPPPDGYNEDTNQIWIQMEGEPPFQIDPNQGRAPWWSPDGEFIAFESNRTTEATQYLIFVHSLKDGSTVPVTPMALNVQHAKWSPDGSQIVFAVGFRSGGAGIAVVDLSALGFRA